jgi:ankyrin repeat protein
MIFMAVPARTQNSLGPYPRLSRAAEKNDLEGVKARLAAGDPINQIDRWGWSPLLWTVYYNYLDLTNFLLEHGADPNVRAGKGYGQIEEGSTPLIIATYFGHPELVAPLLAHGAKTDPINVKAMSAVDYAKQLHFKLIQSMLEHPAPR